MVRRASLIVTQERPSLRFFQALSFTKTLQGHKSQPVTMLQARPHAIHFKRILDFGEGQGSVVTAEEREDGILIRPAVVVPIEKYTPERKAQFLLSNATNATDYRKARTEVQKLGIDPDSIPHRRPAS